MTNKAFLQVAVALLVLAALLGLREENVLPVTLLIALPMQLWAARRFTRPHPQIRRFIERQQTDFVSVDTPSPSSAIDPVRNLAALTNRPILLSNRALSATQIAEICGTVTLITSKDFHRTGFALRLDGASPQFDALLAPIIRKPRARSAR